MKIGILALQGAFEAHANMLDTLSVETVEVRHASQFNEIDRLIIPGGESTSIGLIAERWNLLAPLREWIHSGHPTWGTCAGLIMLANTVVGQKDGSQSLVGGLDITANRNFFGRQVDSFETQIPMPVIGERPFPGVFIRAPAIIDTLPSVTVLASVVFPNGDTMPVAVRQRNILATTFHPELTTDSRIHRYFKTL